MSESVLPMFSSKIFIVSGLGTLWEREVGGMIWENGIETCIVSYKKRITSPGSMQDTGCLGWGWCTGTTQRDGTGREVGAGFGMGNTCMPVADSF